MPGALAGGNEPLFTAPGEGRYCWAHHTAHPQATPRRGAAEAPTVGVVCEHKGLHATAGGAPFPGCPHLNLSLCGVCCPHFLNPTGLPGWPGLSSGVERPPWKHTDSLRVLWKCHSGAVGLAGARESAFPSSQGCGYKPTLRSKGAGICVRPSSPTPQPRVPGSVSAQVP